ncbi:Putative lipid-binding protein At4g00165 [Linum perenne]
MGFTGSKAVIALLFLTTLFLTSASCNDIPCQPKNPPEKPYKSPPSSSGEKKCPTNVLKFGVCGSWLGLVYEVVGSKPSKECCTVIKGIVDLEAAMCLCYAVKANVLGMVKIDIPIAVSMLVNSCGGNIPQGYKCP